MIEENSAKKQGDVPCSFNSIIKREHEQGTCGKSLSGGGGGGVRTEAGFAGFPYGICPCQKLLSPNPRYTSVKKTAWLKLIMVSWWGLRGNCLTIYLWGRIIKIQKKIYETIFWCRASPRNRNGAHWAPTQQSHKQLRPESCQQRLEIKVQPWAHRSSLPRSFNF